MDENPEIKSTSHRDNISDIVPKKEKLPSVGELFGRPVQQHSKDEADTRGRLIDKTMNDENLDSKFDLSNTEENRFLFLFARANTYSEIIKKRYGSEILTDFFYKYKRQSISKGRISRHEMVDIIAGRNFPDFDDIKGEFQSTSLLDKLRGVIRR